MKKQIIASALIGFLVSCSGENDPAAETDTMQIKSCSVISNDVLSENLASPIGLYILTEDNEPYANESYKNSASLTQGKWVIDIPVYIAGKGLVYAYYPYSLSDTYPGMKVDMSRQIDILYCKAPPIIGVGSSSLSLELSHALSQIVVTVENEEVESLAFSSPQYGTFNVCTGTFSDLINGNVKSTSGKLFIIPHLCTDSELKFRLGNGIEYTYAISNMSFSPGENYTYQFKLNANREQLEIGSITVEDWVSDSIFQDYI